MTDAPERIWAYYSTVFGAAWSSCTDDGATEYLRADIAAAREVELISERNEALSRERALLDSNEVNRQAVLDANAAHQRQVDSLRAEVERLTEVRGMYRAAMEELSKSDAEAARLRALLDEARKGLGAIESYLAKGHDKMAHNIARATIAKIGDQHD